MADEDEAITDLTASPLRKKRRLDLTSFFGNTVRKSKLVSLDSEKIQPALRVEGPVDGFYSTFRPDFAPHMKPHTVCHADQHKYNYSPVVPLHQLAARRATASYRRWQHVRQRYGR